MTIREMFEVFDNGSFEVMIIDEDRDVIIYTGKVSEMDKSLEELVICLWTIEKGKIVINI